MTYAEFRRLALAVGWSEAMVPYMWKWYRIEAGLDPV